MNQPTTITIESGPSTVTITMDEDGVTVDAATAEPLADEPEDDVCTDPDCPIHGPGASPEKAMTEFVEAMGWAAERIRTGTAMDLAYSLKLCALATRSIEIARKQGIYGQGEIDLMAEAVDEAKAEIRKRGIPIPLI